MKRLRDKLAAQPRFILLIDGVGAAVSASGLAVLHGYFGLPPNTVTMLAAIATGFAVYSLSSYALGGKHWRALLLGICFANALYCCLTIGLMVWHRGQLTAIGWTYFSGEIAIIALLIGWEIGGLRRTHAEA